MSNADVYAIFELLKESTWIESLDVYGYTTFHKDLVPELVATLPESTWAENLPYYKPDIENEGLKFLTVPEMKKILEQSTD